MADVTVPYMEAGQAAFEPLDTYLQNFLLSGQYPPLATGIPMVLEENLTVSQFHVLGLNGNNRLVPAVEGVTQAQFICTQAVTTGAGETTKTVSVFYSGNFNPDALVWDASYNSDALKRAAFMGAPSPTQIVITPRTK
jgi:hypothetical protein